MKGRDLVGGGAHAARDDGTRVAHPFAGGGRLAGNKRRHRLGHMLGDVGRGRFLGVAADFADQEDRFGFRVVLKHLKKFGLDRADDRIATDAHTGRLTKAKGGKLMNRLIGEGSRPTDEPDIANFVDVAGHDSQFGLARSDHAGTVGPDKANTRALLDKAFGAGHVENRNAFGDGNDQGDARIGRFADGIGGGGRWHKHHRRIGAGVGNRLGDRVEKGDPLLHGAAFAGNHPANDLGAIFTTLDGVKSARFAQPLNDNFCVLVYQNAHAIFPISIVLIVCLV